MFAVVAFAVANLFGTTAAQAPCAGKTGSVAIVSDSGASPSGSNGAVGTQNFALARSGPPSPVLSAVTINGNGSRNTITGSNSIVAAPALLRGGILSRGIA